ncbi:hypothetical protein GJAV_G00048330 [Gymnothorax javanicus]|nr:hypothetical protein GJAV_G00048330 [Gymnothorax javanicus]
MNEDELVEYFRAQMRQDPDVASAVAAIRTLLEFLKRDKGETIQGLRENLTQAIDRLTGVDSSVAVSSGGELFLVHQPPRLWSTIALPTTTTSVRSKMRDAGLYEKFHEDAVDNVSRFLRYLQPTGDEPTMDFLSRSQQTREYISSLRRMEMTAATIINYMKNMIRFVDYLKTRLNLTITDKDLRDNLQAFKEFLQTMKKPVSKAHSRDVCKTR